MAYNPGVSDISGQIRAQGIVGGAQSIGSSVENAFKEYRQNETKRKLASAAVNGALQADPAVMQALSSDPEAAKLLQKRQSGKATVSDEMYLAGMVGAYGKAKEEKQATEFRAMQMQREKDVEQRRAQALNELAKLERTNFDGIDSTTAGALQDVLAATKYSGRPMDPEHIAAFVQNARDKEQRNYLEQMKLEARAREPQFLEGPGGTQFVRDNNGDVKQVTMPKGETPDAPNKDGTTVVDYFNGKTYVYKGGRQYDLATGAPRVVQNMGPGGEILPGTMINPMVGGQQGGPEPDAVDSLIGRPKPKPAPATPSKAPEIDNRAPDGKKPFVIIRRN